MLHSSKQNYQVKAAFAIIVALIIMHSLWRYTDTSFSSTISKFLRKEQNHSRIFFFETSGHGVVSLRFLTAVESAALWNPHKDITVYLFSNGTQQLTPVMASLQDKYVNIRYETTTLEDFVRRTPLEAWYREGKWRQSQYQASHISDGVRYLELWRTGGIYLDMDILTLKQLDFPENAVFWENEVHVASGCLAFQKKHPLMLAALNRFVQFYDPVNYDKNGSPMVTEEYRKYGEKLGDSCDVAELPVCAVSPTVWVDGLDYFDPGKKEGVIEKTKRSSAAHWWNDLSKDMKIEADSNCAFVELVKNNCPVLSSEINSIGCF